MSSILKNHCPFCEMNFDIIHDMDLGSSIYCPKCGSITAITDYSVPVGATNEMTTDINTDSHLMSQEKLSEFFQEMYRQLEKHKDQKIGLKDWQLVDVWKLCKDELRLRLNLIETRDPQEIEKQCVHMANYLWFLWQKCREVHHPIAVGDKRQDE